MITNKTVVVVGAGASADVGMPLGPELRDRIAIRLEGQGEGASRYFNSAVHHLFERDRERAGKAIEAAQYHAIRIRTAASIDNYLDQHKDEKDFVRVAKMAIAYEIALAEQKSKMHKRRSGANVIDDCPDYFLLDLLNILVRGHQVSNLQSSLDNLTFVVFNYDRCLEHFFSYWLNHRFEEEAMRLTGPNIIHVYGSLGELKAQNPFTYDGNMPFQNPHLELPIIEKSIKVFTEQEESDVSMAIKDALNNASAMLFLGFGFEEQNMRFFDSLSGMRKVFATTFGQSEANKDHLRNLLAKKLSRGRKEEVHLGSVKCKTLFSDFSQPLASAVGSLPPRSFRSGDHAKNT